MSQIRQRQRFRRGFVLLAVMVFLVVAALLLAAVAGHSARLAGQARARQQVLQQKWGTISCQRAVLSLAGSIFDELSDRQFPRVAAAAPPLAIHSVFRLGEVQFDLTLADEDAKVNLNTLYHYQGNSRAEQYLHERVARGRILSVRLVPEVESQNLLDRDPRDRADDDDGPPPAFRSWGQVFDLGGIHPSGRVVLGLPAMTAQTTCWGSGRLNVKRADDASIESIGSIVVSRGMIERLIRDYRDDPRLGIERMIDQLTVRQRDRFLLHELLGEQSSCYSLWITARSAGRTWQRFTVAQQHAEGQTRNLSFLF